MRIIPAIDLYQNKCVRLTGGNFGSMTFYEVGPLTMALRFQDAGLQYIHVIDLEGAKAGKVIHEKVIEEIAARTNLKIQTGGGIRTTDDVERLLNAGAQLVITGSIAVKSPELLSQWIATFGSDHLYAAVDVRDNSVVTSAWQSMERKSPEDEIERMNKMGISNFLCTDVSADGKLLGPNIELYQSLVNRFPQIALCASGGVASLSHLEGLKSTGVDSVVIGKALYENRLDLSVLAEFEE